MENLKNFLKDLIFAPTVSGYEKMSAEKIKSMCEEFADGFFTRSRVTETGSVVLCKESGKVGAKRICFDAHIDTVGFAVSEICKGGFLRLVPLGGIDVNILPASEVLICADEPFYGVFTSIPPHLSSSSKLPEVGELLVDTGFSEKQLEERVKVGTPVMFAPHFTSLLSDRVSAINLDDKACIATAVLATKMLGQENTENTDVYVYLSSGEERGGNGSHHIYEEINPDALVVLDVNFAKEKGSVDGEYGVLGEGAMLSYSSVTSLEFTRFVESCAKGLPLQRVNEMTGTGTNADVSARTGRGIPTAVLSVPLRYMHSSVECADLCDIVTCAEILRNLAKEYDKSDVCEPVYYKGGDLGVL